VTAGEKCEKLLGRLIVNIPVQDVETDEIWNFIQKKEKQCGDGRKRMVDIGGGNA